MRSFLFVNKINYLIGIYIVKKVGLNDVYRKHNQYQIMGRVIYTRVAILLKNGLHTGLECYYTVI